MQKEITAPVAPYGEEKKTKKIKMKLWPLISQKWLQKFPSNLVCGMAYLAGTSVVKLVPIRIGIMELQKCENYIFFLPVNIVTVWCAGFLGRTTYGMCLDVKLCGQQLHAMISIIYCSCMGHMSYIWDCVHCIVKLWSSTFI